MAKKLALALIVTLITLLLCEMGLRFFGFKPGIVLPANELGDSYYTFPGKPEITYEFMPDSDGIFRYNKAYFDTCTSNFNEAVFTYLKNTRLNEYGFRQVGNKTDSTKTKVLLLGDSFTWGFTARPIDSSFADVLAGHGYTVFNFGVPATDVVQYEAIARKYIPIVKPDVVIVNFYYSNDFVYYQKHAAAYQYIDYWPCNIGWLPKVNADAGISDSVEVFNTWVDSRNYLLNNLTFGKYSDNKFKRLLAKSVILTYLGKAVCGKENLPVNITKYPRQDITAAYIKNIQQSCDSAGCRLVVAVIPDKKQTDFVQFESTLAVSLKGINYKTFPADRTDYFDGVDNHFNNKGHYNYALFLDSLLSW